MTKVYITESGYKLNVASTLRMTASEAETLLDGVFEPALGNPDADGYVLSSTTAGVRSWVAQSGGGGDVGDLTTTSGSSTNMLRVAAAGGLEYRTTAQVLSDIGAAPTASPTFTGTVTLPTTVASVIKPASDSTTALQLANAAGTAVLTVDTTNGVVAIGGATESDVPLKVYRNSYDAGIKIENNGYTTDALRITSGGTTVFAIRYIGSIEFPLGSNLAPAMTFTGDNNTGVYSPGSDTWSITTGGTERFRISSSGLTAIGMSGTAPTAFADIAASTTSAASLRIRSGTAPSSPNDGDLYYDGSNLLVYVSSAWYTLDKTAV